MAPIDNVWMAGERRGLDYAVAAVSKYFRKNAKNYARRALVLPRKDVRSLKAYAANGNVGSPRGRTGERGGPVLALDPTLKVLEMRPSRRWTGAWDRDQSPYEVGGRAAATNALNLDTNERHPGVPDEIRKALEDLERSGDNGYARAREPYSAALCFETYATLMAAGYTMDFVASYLVALGGYADGIDCDLRKIYVPPHQRPRLPKRFR
ncbi:hypothetical protein PFJ02_19830 [Mycobacterium xenopi]|uniref:Uncharacterized protein n=2 Tax=Mycobacterium xenopi TaxID=1789 RepID=A0AAD1M2D5_MYCXE|nr:hypothetical protein [Mycobacterium xenopi]MDA3640732.1 hypothetical protein [Mycobacterium xenopi]MDA3664253.1 hypothetical protein [Mycobacterium xenopi]ORX22135.1 hypothetical protein AWC32_00590 [Mycobacterium xenopi]SPX90887.1 Uncharacterised protein [Mycobacterium xenopi]BBU24069.1 hypothetical protein MYXE_38590 [Mycobacterium xenopi]